MSSLPARDQTLLVKALQVDAVMTVDWRMLCSELMLKTKMITGMLPIHIKSSQPLL